MKSRFLIIVGMIVILTISIGAVMWPEYGMVCNNATVEHLQKYSNLFDKNTTRQTYGIIEIGYQFGVHGGNIRECVDFTLEKRTSTELEKNTNLDKINWKVNDDTLEIDDDNFPHVGEFIEKQIWPSPFQEIMNNIEKTGYGICGIEVKQMKIIIHLNWIFEGSEQEQKIISKIPSDIDYEIIYYDDYVDFSPQTLREPHCEILRRDSNQDGQTESFSFCGADGFDSKGNLNTDNSTHHWDENYCVWQKITPSSINPVYPRFANGITEIINPEHESLKYRVTSPIIDDTYLSKNVQQWKDAWPHELEAEYQKYGDNFYRELGSLLMKNEMQYQMNTLGIVNTSDDFEVYSGMQLDSLPPHIIYSSVIHATDGHYYWLQGGTNANKVNYYKTTQLQYPDLIVSTAIPGETLPKTSILMKGNNDLKSMPPFVVLSQPGDVEFYNDTPGTLTIYLDKDGLSEFSFETSQQLSVRSHSETIWTFAEPGSYSWHGEVPTMINGKEYELNTGGGILVLSDDMSGLSKKEQMETAKMMLMTSGLPITGMGQRGEDDTLYISLDNAINELLPESRQYYLETAQQIIPFDITIVLER